jgi:transcriptional regulator with XRE-family HTH domain
MTKNLKTIKKLLIDRDLTEASLARHCGTSAAFIADFLRGYRKSKKMEPVIAQALRISEEKLSRLIRA